MELACISAAIRRKLVSCCAAIAVVLLSMATGCPSTPGNGDTPNVNDNTPDTGGVTAQIVSFSTNFGVSALSPPISVLYTVTGSPDSVAGFFVPVADGSPGAAAIGDRVIVATNLPAGTNRAFSFDPLVAGVGFFRVGVLVTDGGTNVVAESDGSIQVQGPPAPFFIQPAAAVTEVTQGDEVFVSFDAGDPEGDVQWRLYYLNEVDSRQNPEDQLGTQLSTGTGNVGSAVFGTSGLAPGDYELGISATDSGLSIATTVATGNADRIVTIPNDTQAGRIVRVREDTSVVAPTFAFSAPGVSDVDLFRNEAYSIAFSAAVTEPGATGAIELFYDDDALVSNGFRASLADNLPHSATSFPLPNNLPEGTWFLGATIRTLGGVSPAVTVYATGRVVVVRDPTLDVTNPDLTLPVRPAALVPVKWTTNTPASAGTVDVFAKTVDSSGIAFGPEIEIMADAPVTTTTAVFASDLSGLFEVSVRLEFLDGTSKVATAPLHVRVSSLPPIAWLGSLAESVPGFEGAIFGGVNFEDNAGSAFSTAGDLNGDGLDEFVIAARYGKPFFVNPSGVGPGEGYIVYGVAGAGKLVGEYNLNSVGTPSLRGVTLTGIPTVNNSSETDGISDVALIPDADGDGKGELVFGIPHADSAGNAAGPLDAPGQFLNGGIVILSSNNSILTSPTTGGTVIKLDEVGQRFTNVSVEPDDRPSALEDALQFPDDPEGGNVCVAGNDGVDDTIVGPSVGFTGDLAPQLWEQFGFSLVTGSASPQNCPTQFDLLLCTGRSDLNVELDTGSGFYPADATPLEPRGARIIGATPGDMFGASVTSSNALGDNSPGDIIVAAPNRDAKAEFVDGVSTDISTAGVAFLANNRNLWGPDNFFQFGRTPPTPHQYVMGFASHCAGNRAPPLTDVRRVAGGNSAERIQNVIGIDDFNGDGRNDFAVGAPLADGGQGRVYIAYRRDEAIEGDFVLNKLELAPNNSERLDGMLIVTGGAINAFGSSLDTGFDFNADGISDLVVSSPNASGGTGEVVVIFGNAGVVSPATGITVNQLLETTRTVTGRPVAARITGPALDTNALFGFKVANAGDLDGDGFDDLLVAAPNASPRFDPNPNDGVDELTEDGLDLDFDGLADEVDSLTNAGIVYVIFGSNRLDQIASSDITISIDELGSNELRGMMIVGRHAGDRLGGGDAGDANIGGISGKAGRGRSNGLAPAGDVDGDGRADFLIGSVLADPRRDPNTGSGVQNGGEAYLIYGSIIP